MTADARPPTGQPLEPIERSRLISESLRQMARISRYNDPRQQLREARAQRRRDYVTPILFLALFVLPSLAGIGVFGFYLSDRYVAETQFAIRPAVGATEAGGRGESGSGGSGGSGNAFASVIGQMIAQDIALAAEYITSRPMVEAVERALPLRAIFSRDSIDEFSRFDAEEPVERLVRYWRDRVQVTVEGAGLVSVKVNAFAPEEAVAISRAILAESERRINELTAKAREDALAESERALARAEERLTGLQVEMRNLRNRGGVLDAEKTAGINVKMVAQVREQRIALGVRLALLQRDLKEDTRSVQDLKAQIAQLDATIAGLEREATTQDPNQRRVLSDALTRFEQLEVDRKNAQAFYGRMIAAREQARMIADRQVEFFTVAVQPSLPQSAEQPRRLQWIAVTEAGAALAFGLSILLRNQLT
ncbi:capsule polysaccharide export protein-like protein [Methylobacterium sp. 4-46]|uniref:capsule polysaccharide transporter n=1 Tax=unclassified Methylobacterium TaxID=2615210 RepID=UPI000165CC23|nr:MULTISPECIES: capsule polysaccharide transporter [unclassified Methylobacterium]ACA20290.1 capsule polysaccharide export protein-like protein [Methylobacterium sp. 4-46]